MSTRAREINDDLPVVLTALNHENTPNELIGILEEEFYQTNLNSFKGRTVHISLTLSKWKKHHHEEIIFIKK